MMSSFSPFLIHQGGLDGEASCVPTLIIALVTSLVLELDRVTTRRLEQNPRLYVQRVGNRLNVRE